MPPKCLLLPAWQTGNGSGLAEYSTQNAIAALKMHMARYVDVVIEEFVP
jgi:hypothetical protein